jgi:hypothetical protein
MDEQMLENWAKPAHVQGASRSELAEKLGMSKQPALGEIQMTNSGDQIPAARGSFLAQITFIAIAPAPLLCILLAVLIVEPKECPC